MKYSEAITASGSMRQSYLIKKPSNKISIIIADDSADDQQLILEALKTINPEIEHTSVFNGQQLLDLLTNTGMYTSSYKYHPNAIILDLNMPVMSGLDALKKIRNLEKNKAISVFILHTARQDDQINQCSLLGVQGIYAKPSNFDELKSIIETIYFSCCGNHFRRLS